MIVEDWTTAARAAWARAAGRCCGARLRGLLLGQSRRGGLARRGRLDRRNRGQRRVVADERQPGHGVAALLRRVLDGRCDRRVRIGGLELGLSLAPGSSQKKYRADDADGDQEQEPQRVVKGSQAVEALLGEEVLALGVALGSDTRINHPGEALEQIDGRSVEVRQLRLEAFVEKAPRHVVGHEPGEVACCGEVGVDLSAAGRQVEDEEGTVAGLLVRDLPVAADARSVLHGAEAVRALRRDDADLDPGTPFVVAEAREELALFGIAEDVGEVCDVGVRVSWESFEGVGRSCHQQEGA